jgi:arabinose-5-phosphate isomerase
MTLSNLKNQSEEDFAVNHPAGRLGKRLTLKVADLMHESPNVSADAGWLEVIKAISKNSLGAVNVIDENTQLIGIVTDGDLRRAIENNQDFSELNAEKMMTKNPTVATPEMLAYHALQLMENRTSQISVLPVVAENKCVGLLRLHDIVRSGL